MPKDACQSVIIFRQIYNVETQIVCSCSSASTPSSPATDESLRVFCLIQPSALALAGWALFGQSSAAEPAVVKCLVYNRGGEALGRTLLRRSARVTKEEGKRGLRRSARRVRRRRRGWGLRAVGAVKKEEGEGGLERSARLRRSARRVRRRRRGWGMRAVGAVKEEEGGGGAGAVGALEAISAPRAKKEEGVGDEGGPGA
ncbi:uncharacterized protein SCHCODRAFT_02602889 [Schizophyllum commune H4-8]|uniref:Uncharacterized protein n=1 Tax=Schizophyllum commune (strain H4-8 / FGSC 9210) TaxID=578458 RepID=D8QD41_SCHCM